MSAAYRIFVNTGIYAIVFCKRYSVTFGLFALVCVFVLLFSTPESLFSHGVAFIDSELHRSSGNEAYVKTKMNPGSQEHVGAFPAEILGVRL